MLYKVALNTELENIEPPHRGDACIQMHVSYIDWNLKC